jgi:CHASE3 domain sensor protein
MVQRNRTDFRTANVRGAFVLGSLLLAVLVVATVVSVRIYTQLDASVRDQRALVDAEQELDAVVRVQLDQETGLRGFLATGQALFLDPYRLGNARYDAAVADLARTTAELGIPELASPTAELRSIHATWRREVAQPLLARPRAPDALTRETLGKVLIDQLRGDTTRTRALLEHRLAVVQDDLKRRIDEALLAGLGSVLVFGIVSIVYVGSRQQMLAAIDRERSIVETLQGAFRTDLDHVPGARVGTAYVAADRDAAVGGDLYDVRRLDERRGLLLVADISGKGIAAAVNTAFVKYSMRTLALSTDDPAAILESFNRVFVETIGDPNLFVVAFVGVVDVAAGTLTYASAGHSGAYQRRGGRVVALDVTGPIVGLGSEFGYKSHVVSLHPGDLIVLATDGLTEARDRNGNVLDDAGAMDLIKTTSSDPQTCADELVASVRRRGNGTIADDLALLVVAIDEVA